MLVLVFGCAVERVLASVQGQRWALVAVRACALGLGAARAWVLAPCARVLAQGVALAWALAVSLVLAWALALWARGR